MRLGLLENKIARWKSVQIRITPVKVPVKLIPHFSAIFSQRTHQKNLSFPGKHVHRPTGSVRARRRSHRAHPLSNIHERVHLTARPLYRHRQELRNRHLGLHPRRPKTSQETPPRPPRLLR